MPVIAGVAVVVTRRRVADAIHEVACCRSFRGATGCHWAGKPDDGCPCADDGCACINASNGSCARTGSDRGCGAGPSATGRAQDRAQGVGASACGWQA